MAYTVTHCDIVLHTAYNIEDQYTLIKQSSIKLYISHWLIYSSCDLSVCINEAYYLYISIIYSRP